MKLLRTLDKGLFRTIYVICGIIMIAMLLIINIQVLSRSAFKFSLGGVSDLPPFLMIYAIWLGAILSARSDDHIKIQLLDLFIKNKKILDIIEIIINIVIAAALLLFMKSAIDYTANAYFYSSTDMGTKIPLWCLYIVMPISSVLMSLYYIVNTVNKIRGLVSDVGNRG